jgi:hypothetical protein
LVNAWSRIRYEQICLVEERVEIYEQRIIHLSALLCGLGQLLLPIPLSASRGA